MQKNLFEEVNNTIETFLKTVESFPPDKFNVIPFEGSWTAAQVTDHILKGVVDLPQLLQAKVINTDRQPDEKVAMIEKIFLDFSSKMKSPDFILPRTEPLDINELSQAWQKTKKEILDAVSSLDLSMIATAFELPGMGPFTRFEWIWFAICHIKRHTHQLKNIHRLIVEDSSVPIH